ncbi:MAG: AraC family transcriptional regulator [Edaphobacter sp.]|uniref:AraC family transcriptional regulator n=1 Tax=Edaphobacter sp. TaxID=1934404 RepID=UPI002399679E|nr:AraC family transcriptional regulator [Edaphobacter sp.]MDE1178812.1 AraC family transcriptional regulator [Edaphobacter sp.]
MDTPGAPRSSNTISEPRSFHEPHPLHALCSLASRYGTREGFTPAAFTSDTLPGIRFTTTPSAGDPVCAVEGPAFAVVLQGAKRTVVGPSSYRYSAGQYLVLSLELPITATAVDASPQQPLLSFGMRLRAAHIASLLLEMPATPPNSKIVSSSASSPESGQASSGVAVSDAGPDLLDAVLRLVQLIDRPSDIPILAPMIEREILWRLLTGPQGALIRQIGLADSRLSQISRSVSWIRHNYNKSFRTEDLAQLSGMSVSTFHRNFRTVTAMTPLEYQKQIRLQEARTRLLADPRDIAAIGFAVGYDSPSQFSREYRRLFGDSPGRDAQRLHAQPAIV